MIGIAYCLIIIRVALPGTLSTNTVFSIAQVSMRQAVPANSNTDPMEPTTANVTQHTHVETDAQSSVLDPSGKITPLQGV
jgi:hypothetical protein